MLQTWDEKRERKMTESAFSLSLILFYMNTEVLVQDLFTFSERCLTGRNPPRKSELSVC